MFPFVRQRNLYYHTVITLSTTFFHFLKFFSVVIFLFCATAEPILSCKLLFVNPFLEFFSNLVSIRYDSRSIPEKTEIIVLADIISVFPGIGCKSCSFFIR